MTDKFTETEAIVGEIKGFLAASVVCPVCDGTGVVVWDDSDQPAVFSPRAATETEQNDSKTRKHICPACDGSGDER